MKTNSEKFHMLKNLEMRFNDRRLIWNNIELFYKK